MKKWLFILGILCCSVLFFMSGILIGYSSRDNGDSSQIENFEKEKRKPSNRIGDILSPFVGGVIDSAILQARTKIRLPRQIAIQKANDYK